MQARLNTLMHRIPFCWNTCKIKIIVPVYNTKSYKGNCSTPPLILNLIAPSIVGWLCPRAGVNVTEEMKPLVPARIGTQYHPPHSLVTILTELSQPAGTYTGKVSALILTRQLMHWQHLQVSCKQTWRIACLSPVCLFLAGCAVNLCHSLERRLLKYYIRHVRCEQGCVAYEYGLKY